MRGDEDLLVYVSARWPVLVRSLVLLGASEPEAHELAAEALSRCRREWATVSREGDVDGLVFDELLAGWGGADPERAAQVLTRYAGRPGATSDGGPTEEELRERAEEVTVGPPPTLAELADRARRRRVRATRKTLAVLVPLLLIVSAGTWWTTRDEPQGAKKPALEEVAVGQQTNPAGVIWYDGGVLHLQQVVLTLPGVRSLVAVRGGAVYADTRDRVIHVDDAGERTLLGTTVSDGDVVADSASGLVAWLAPGTDATSRLSAWSAERDELVGGQPAVEDALRVVAVSGQTVFYADPIGTRAWQPGTPEDPRGVVEPARLLAVAASTRVYQVADEVIRIEEPFAAIAFETAGVGAAVSPDGSLVLTRRSGGPVRLYDVRSGKRVDSGLDGEPVAAALLGPGDRVTYVVGPGTTGLLDLRTCDLATHRCQSLVELPATAAPPLLAA